MAHSFVNIVVHCVFSTKDRLPTIPKELQVKLWAYMAGTGKNIGIPIIEVGGMPNHIHALMALPPTLALATAVQKLKANSSRWLGEHGARFEWQKGYGAISVSPPSVAAVRKYIQNQEVHHSRRTFEQEFLEILKKSGTEFDPAKVFD